ncbi:amidase [Geosmithia morbida]|uniref:Amidase n=1 Tax=Geosmithia morbida TaxID=1094350 RepID=A0A9P5CZZ4_9HYPO|nr:amidase [Geosmithia morbida]KAF4122163.1 amidase [Geosmithia morbida]
MTVVSWNDIGAKKRSALLASFPADLLVPGTVLPPDSQHDVREWPQTSGWFTAEELSITGATATELLGRLASGEVTAEAAVRAFYKRAIAAHQLTNCLSENCFERGLARAKELDAEFARTGKPTGPLHGLPISLKDNINVRGLDSTVGFTSHVSDPASSDAALVTILEAAGAVLYVKTNVPTAMMIAETVNNVFGRTTNPINRRVTPGGSSGGEAALITFGGSPLGVGTDIGGSLRIPAACCGLFTLRASGGRFPVRNCRSGMPGQEAVMSVNGPLGRTLDDISMYTQAVLAGQPWLYDAKCLSIPWRPVEPLPPSLKIAVLWDDGVIRPAPPIARGLRTAVDKLRAAGHTVIDWDPVDQKAGASLLRRMFLADGGLTIRHEVLRGGEPWRPEMKAYEEAEELGTADMWKLHLERSAFQNRYLDRWNAAGIDAILCPTMPSVAVKHGETRNFGYTGVFNVVDYSVVSFPTGLTVDKNTDEKEERTEYLSEDDRLVTEDYDPETFHGLPINLQLAARRLEEEKVLAMTKVVLSALSA